MISYINLVFTVQAEEKQTQFVITTNLNAPDPRCLQVANKKATSWEYSTVAQTLAMRSLINPTRKLVSAENAAGTPTQTPILLRR